MNQRYLTLQGLSSLNISIINFKTSISSCISIKIELVTHFSVTHYTLLKQNVTCLKRRFSLFVHQNITKLCRSIHFGLVALNNN